MFPPKFLLVVAITLCLSLSYFHFEAYGDASGDVNTSPNACLNCSKCDPPCQQRSPPISTDPSYGAAPSPPPPSPTPSGYSIYDAPPPPHKGGHSKCPPAGGGVECCTPPPPYYYTYYGPPNPYYGPPYLYAPPNPYTYVPYNEGFASTVLPIQVLLMMHFSFIFLF